jgi:hypothetical protein
MRSVRNLFLAVGVLLMVSLVVRADDQADLKAIVDKAIKAQGGEEKLSKLKAATSKSKGKVYVMGDGLDFTGEIAYQSPDRLSFQMQIAIMGQNFAIGTIVNGDKGWKSFNGTTQELEAEELAEAKENMYSEWVTHLYPLKDPAFTLSALGEAKVGDNDAVGIRVSRKDHRDINFYFDKKTGLLLKRETRIKDFQSGGTEMTQENLYSDYQEIDGIPNASKVTILRDGKKYVEAEATELKRVEKLDDSVFAKP